MNPQHCNSGNCQAPAAIAELRTEIKSLGREITQLRSGQSDVTTRVASVCTSTDTLAAETRAILQINREEIRKLFTLSERLTEQALSLAGSTVTHRDLDSRLKQADMELDAVQRDYVTRAEHEETKRQLATINIRLAKVIAIASVASSILTSIAQPLLGSLFRGMLQ